MVKTDGRSRKRERRQEDHLSALADLLGKNGSNPVQLFEHSLTLIRQRFGADRALLTRVTGLGHEVFWWSAAKEADLRQVFEQPEKSYCSWVMSHPDRILVVRNAPNETAWRDAAAWRELGIRAYAGVALWEGDKPVGTLCIQHSEALTMDRGALALMKALGHLLSKTLEAEQLKQELMATREALELSSAVVQDSALQSPRSALPNRRYLEIWIRATAFLARRRNEHLSLLVWSQPMERGLKGRIKSVAEALRGEDLLVELAPDQYLLILPRTPPDGAEILWARVQERLGVHPAGGTIWDPRSEDLLLREALHRATLAMALARERGNQVVWHVEPPRAEPA